MINRLFSKEYAENLKGQDLISAKESLVISLSEYLSLKFEIFGDIDKDNIHSTEIRSISTDSPYTLRWRGYIGTTNYRDDDQYEYGAFLFPLIGDSRACVIRHTDDEETVYDYAYRYLILKIDGKWYDLGWQIDEFYEFEHWYIKG
ncbi:hypothetical protein [Zooshikella ganghwensis]|uniref:Uncharacterized protein n=1 Tax=Zooshikella ganghwensis TaxID=202772 RepID=A0A4P9VGN6_9GAMM|nr:hypothetical protein [Zooshikella ganghwensis]RDH41257.1 hypothetical protein B9G39_29555 [Zooshikella ganghwensis]